jgi:hypothetical protein
MGVRPSVVSRWDYQLPYGFGSVERNPANAVGPLLTDSIAFPRIGYKHNR